MSAPGVEEISPAQAAARLVGGADAAVLIDVREPKELMICGVAGALHIPMGDIPVRLRELHSDRELIIMCHTGRRSLSVAMWLKQQGFENVKNLRGGIDAWAREVDPALARY